LQPCSAVKGGAVLLDGSIEVVLRVIPDES